MIRSINKYTNNLDSYHRDNVFFKSTVLRTKIFSTQSNNTKVSEIFSVNLYRSKTESTTFLHIKSRLKKNKETFIILNINLQEKVLYFEMLSILFTKSYVEMKFT